MQEDLAQPHHVIEHGGGDGLVFRAPLLGVAHQVLHRELGGLEVSQARSLQARDVGLFATAPLSHVFGRTDIIPQWLPH